MADRRREDVNRRIDELEATLEDLRDELEPQRGPLGPLRPPRPREVLRFADEFAIPAAIAALEANVRALELVQAGIRASDPDRAAEAASRTVRDQASVVSRATLDRLDRALSDLESAMAGTGMPANPEARELLSEARRLNDEIRDRMAAEPGSEQPDAVRIDVESELESIRREVDDDEAIEFDDSE